MRAPGLAAACAALFLAVPAAAAGEAGTGLGALIDKVLADPADPEARARLRKAASAAVERRTAEAAQERKELMKGAARDRKTLQELNVLKAARMKAWEEELSAVCALAGGVDTSGDAVTAYERLLSETPVYSDNRAKVEGATEKVKGIFYATIKREFPYLVQGRTQANERDIAALMFSRASVQDDTVRYLDTGVTQKVLDIAGRLRRLELELGRQYANLTEGVALYSKKRYAPALEFFEKVIGFDSENEEALFYRSRATEEESAAALKKDKR